MIKDKTILITGGAGSLGSGLCKYILNKYIVNDKPKKLIVFSTDWHKQDALRRELNNPSYMRWFIGNIRDYDRLYEAFEDVDIVIHAAAIKCVDTCTKDPAEALKTNVDGTQNVIRAAINRKVKKSILISTDKSVSASNIYGTTKALSEDLFINANNCKGDKDIKFSVCRFGNLIGSSGSVVEIWNRLIVKGEKTLPVTHKDMTRYWYSINDAVEFILHSIDRMNGGEIFYPDNMPSIKILDLCRAYGMPYNIIGMRKGERLHENIADDKNSYNNKFLTVEQIRKTIGM